MLTKEGIDDFKPYLIAKYEYAFSSYAMKHQVEILTWDSNFFNIKVGRIKDINAASVKFKNVLGELKILGIELSYYSAPRLLNNIESTSAFYEFNLVDKKTTFIKKIEKINSNNKLVSEYDSDYPEDKLINLAIQSGIYSRFNIDRKIDRIKFEELYKEWIINSVNKKLAKEVLVYKNKGVIEGFVTLGEKLGVADIGIIAVDEYSRGKGIGKILMTAAENWFANNHYNHIQVVTQGDNLPACKLYEATGYKIKSVEYFYHLWRK